MAPYGATSTATFDTIVGMSDDDVEIARPTLLATPGYLGVGVCAEPRRQRKGRRRWERPSRKVAMRVDDEAVWLANNSNMHGDGSPDPTSGYKCDGRECKQCLAPIQLPILDLEDWCGMLNAMCRPMRLGSQNTCCGSKRI